MLTIVEAGRQFRSRELSPETLVDTMLDRIRRDNPKLNAWYEVFWDEARQAAEAASKELRSGLDRGPLHGIPIGVKDLFDVKGYRTTAGAHPGFHPAAAIEDASVIARLNAAGAVLLGKTALHEWAFGVSTNNAHFGPTRNPHDLQRICGGSSGGSGSALAGELCLGALGTDTGGSIRIPSSLCGVVGIKPTLGRVSTQGVAPLSRSLDTVGPMAMTVDDAFLLLEAICGFRPEPTARPRIVVPEGYFLEECDPRVADLVRAAGTPQSLDLGDVKAAWEANSVILLSDAAAIHESRLREHPDWFGESVGPRLKNGQALRGVDYARARDEQRDWTARLERILAGDTVLAVPATPVPATVIGDREGPALSRVLTRFTSPFNLAGLPVLSVPIGRVDGLPVGLQLVAGAGKESLLRSAAALLGLWDVPARGRLGAMLLSRLWQFLPFVAAGVAFALSLATSLHAILHKRDPRAAVSWSGLIWMVPFGGAMFYLMFGINRIARRAGKLRRRRKNLERRKPSTVCTEEELCSALGPEYRHLASVSRVCDRLTGRSLLEGNRVEMLVNGEQAYPAMLQAIDAAKKSVALEVYIIENDAVGRQFVEALARAQKRGCKVYVLVDYVGSQMSVARALREGGVSVAVFLPPLLIPFRNRYMNLRNHRKILVCDGQVGFTGGMNIRESHLLEKPGIRHEQDTHFRMEGPIAEHLVETFADDWAFVTGEILIGPEWTCSTETGGSANLRGISFDPGENMEVLRLVVGGAVAAAERSIRIVTPYFIPEQSVITALNVAALRGVKVDILIPVRNDSLVVQWATTAMLWQVLINGCRVWLTREPFDHSKLMVVDDAWVFFGSANMDTRSMRLNFEFNVESYDRELAEKVLRHIEAKRAGAREVTLKEVDGRSLPVRIRDGIARLFSPYL